MNVTLVAAPQTVMTAMAKEAVSRIVLERISTAATEGNFVQGKD